MIRPAGSVDEPQMSRLRSSTIKVGPHPDRLEGTYRNRPAYLAVWVSCVLAAPLAAAAMLVATGGAELVAGAVVLGAALGGAVLVGRYGVRPRFEVGAEGVRIVNPTQSWSLSWDQVTRFACRDLLVVVTEDGECLGVSALPARGWGADRFGRPGPVADLADRLNARVAEARCVPA
jgi:hypothetical protein